MTPSDKIREELQMLSKGLVCLVPREDAITKDSFLLSSHERTLCDCQVLKLISALTVAIEALEFYANNGSHVILAEDIMPDNGRLAREATNAIAEILRGKG